MSIDREDVTRIYDSLYDAAESIERQFKEKGIFFEGRLGLELFALGNALFCRVASSEAIKDEFFYLIWTESRFVDSPQCKLEDFKARKEAFFEALKTSGLAGAARLTCVDEDAASIIEKNFWPLAAEWRDLNDEAATQTKRDAVQYAHTIITVCVERVRSSCEARGTKLSDAKTVEYYALFLSILLENGLELTNNGKRYFELVGEQIKIRTPSRKAAMEYRFYNSLAKFKEYFSERDARSSIEMSLRTIEFGRPDAARKNEAPLSAGRAASAALIKSISGLK